MVELTPLEQSVVRALQELGASDETKMKTADDVMKKSKMAKGQITNTLVMLVNKGVVVRKAREKSAGYFVKKQEG
ncbi:MAG: transcriptional regulator [Candidatus Micrarchaeota archaeon]|jgi:predicted transcriptional regulator